VRIYTNARALLGGLASRLTDKFLLQPINKSERSEPTHPAASSKRC
jgi:hypothetical protein